MGATAGIYRGVCVDTADPERLGRIRVQVPQLLGERASGWALPAWSLHDLTIWPEDRLPQPGQGVWVQFEGPDRLTWVSVFGPQEFSQQLLDEDPTNYDTVSVLIVPSLVAGLSVTLVGSVRSAAGAPEGGIVKIQRADAEDGPWFDVVTGVAVSRNGTFTADITPVEGELTDWYRVSFEGMGPYQPSDSPAVQPQQGTLPVELTMLEPALPSQVAWQQPTVFGGYLLDQNNQPLENMLVLLLVRPAGTTAWDAVSGAYTTENGSWHCVWTRSGEQYSSDTEVVAYFSGSDEYVLAFAPEPPMALPPVSVVTTTAIDPITLVAGQPVTISGSVTSIHGAPSPNPRVTVSIRVPSALEGPQQSVHSLNATTVVVDGDLVWSTTWTPPSTSADFTATSAETWVYQASSASVQVLQPRVAVPQNLVLPATLSLDVGFSATAVIKDVNGAVVETGEAVLQRRPEGEEWADYGDPVPIALAGIWSTTQTGSDLTGIIDWRVRYLDNPDEGLLEGFSASVNRNVLPAQPVLSKQTVTHTSADFSWAAVPGATEYEVMRGGAVIATTAATSYSDTGLSSMTEYTYTVRATDGAVYSPVSASITASTGRPETRKTGSFQRTEKISSSGTYRTDYGRWVQDSDYTGADYGAVLQGYYSSSSSMNIGVYNYNGAGFRSWVTTNYGSDVLSNLSWDRSRLYMHRSDTSFTGDGSRATALILYVTNAIPRSSGQPLRAGGDNIGSWNRAATGVGNYSKTVDIQAHWAKHVLMNETNVGGINPNPVRGFALYQNSSTNYSRYLGRRGSDTIAGQLTVDCSWDFVSLSYVAPTWL